MIERALTRVAELTRRGSDVVTLLRDVNELVADSVPHFWTPCWYTLDPATHLITSHFHDGMNEFPAEWLAEEYRGDDVHSLTAVIASGLPISTLHEATGGDPSGTRRWQLNMELGGDQELIAPLRSRGGQVWGALGLYRETGDPTFSTHEREMITRVAPLLADGVRRGLLIGEARDPEFDSAPGLIVLDEPTVVVSMTDHARRWLEDFPDGDLDTSRLPTAVSSVAAAAFDADRHAAPLPELRLRTRRGTWVTLHGSVLHGESGRQAAVIVEPAHPERIVPLLMHAYGLTDREQAVTRLVLSGLSTAAIAERLVVVPATVQQHLKSVFEKTGVRTRRDLTTQVFFQHYEPRLRDNETRVAAGRAVRGGPAESVRH